MPRVLLAGESWSVTSIHTKGFDSFVTSEYAEGADDLLAALRAGGHDVTFMPNHVAAREFPGDTEALAAFDVVLLSDIGANTLLLPPDTFAKGARNPNRLEALRSWTLGGGGLGMIGGYLTFQGIEGKANYRNTVLADLLPVEMEIGDDREECPQGVAPATADPHPVTAGIEGDWPELLGYQRLAARPEATVAATIHGRPLLALGTAGAGRTLAYASDIGHHWAPSAFTGWEGFGRMWAQAADWLAG
ncbi:glutamine amidotransferase [Patulibacter sp. S7RM1-6]